MSNMSLNTAQKCVKSPRKVFEFTQTYLYEPRYTPEMLCHVRQSVASLIADPGVVSLIPAPPHTFMEFDLELLSMVILLLSSSRQ